jgi:hypothetical protein
MPRAIAFTPSPSMAITFASRTMPVLARCSASRRRFAMRACSSSVL